MITLGFHHDEVEHAEEVRNYVQRHALKTHEQWRAEILGEVSAAETEEGAQHPAVESDDDLDVYDDEFEEDDGLYREGLDNGEDNDEDGEDGESNEGDGMEDVDTSAWGV